MKLNISDDLKLPLDFVTQTQAILAKKRVGKTYTAKVQAEELLKANQQIVAIDPTGAWWGLKSSADGKHEGFPIAVFGGEHADVPLEETAGETLATALVEQRFSAILDLSLFRKGQINRFMAPFLETLYRLNREAMHLFVDEADSIAPQKPFGEEARMLGAMEDVVRRGGIRGIGCTLITQRPAVINKNVLTQCEILCAKRIVHHKDIDAIHDWIEVHGDPELAKELISSLPSLPKEDAWFWAPGWGDIFAKIKIRELETFDSGATPKAGEAKKTPKVLATVDLAKLGEQIAATVQRVKDNDPKELKRKVAELQKQILAKPRHVKDQQVIEHAQEIAIRAATDAAKKQTRNLRTLLEEAMKVVVQINAEGFTGTPITADEVSKALQGAAERVIKLVESKLEARDKSLVELRRQAQRIEARAQKMLTDEDLNIDVAVRHQEPYAISPAKTNSKKIDRGPKPPTVTPPEGVSAIQVRILSRLEELLQCTGASMVRKEQLAAWAEYSPNSGGFNNYLGSLRSSGLIDYPQGGYVTITEEGRALAQPENVPTTSEELLERAKKVLGGSEGRLLELLHESREVTSKLELAEAAGFSPNSGGYNNYLGHMRTLGFIDYPQKGMVKCADWMFL